MSLTVAERIAASLMYMTDMIALSLWQFFPIHVHTALFSILITNLVVWNSAFVLLNLWLWRARKTLKPY